MRASLTVGGIEVALVISPGPLEKAVAQRYAPFLGAIEAPVCALTLEATPRDKGLLQPPTALVERVGETTFRVVRPGLPGLFDLAGAGRIDVSDHPCALDNALRLLFGLLAPRHDALMLHATSVMSNSGAHLFTGPQASILANLASDRPLLTHGLVLVRREWNGWLAASTPFWANYEQPGPPRESRLNRLWSWFPLEADVIDGPDAEVSRLAVLQHLFLPTGDPEIHRIALALASDLAEAVPFSGLSFARGPVLWTAEIDARFA